MRDHYRDRDHRSPLGQLQRRRQHRSRSRSPPAQHRDRNNRDGGGPQSRHQQEQLRQQQQHSQQGSAANKPIDREKTCPLLLRVFCTTKRHHPLSDFMQGRTPSNELQIYTWMDATLKELSLLVQEVNPDSRAKGTYFDFAVIYPDTQTQRYKSRDIGTVCNGTKGMDDSVTLKDRRFHIGDYIDIAICPAESTGGAEEGASRRSGHHSSGRTGGSGGGNSRRR